MKKPHRNLRSSDSKSSNSRDVSLAAQPKFTSEYRSAGACPTLFFKGDFLPIPRRVETLPRSRYRPSERSPLIGFFCCLSV
jgi:hypothetical protein